jgi:hypothetical protein
MPTYRLLFFRANRLDRWEEFEAANHLDAVYTAAERQSDDLMELWSPAGKIGVFRPYARNTHSSKGGQKKHAHSPEGAA